MTRLLALCLTLFLAACGGGASGGGDGGTPAPGDGTTPPGGGTPDGGATGGTNSLAVTGTLAFTPAGRVGVVTNASACTIRGTSSSVSAVAVVAASYAVACGAIAETPPPSSSFLLVSVTRQRTDGQPASAVATGSYTITTTAPAADEPRANVTVLKRDASGGVDLASSIGGAALSGTVTLTSVGATVAGTVDAGLSGGGRVTGSFSAPSCATATPAELCLAAGGTPPVTSQFPPGAQ